MGKQISFLMDENDEERFFKFVSNSGIIYDAINHKPIDKLPLKNSGNGWFILYFLEKKNKNTFNKNSTEKIDACYDPVIEWTRTIVGAYKNGITIGRLWLEMNIYDSQGNYLRKDESLDHWYKQLVKWVKKNLLYYYNRFDERKYYTSPSLISLLEKGFKVY